MAIAAVAFGMTAYLLAAGFIESTLSGMREATIGSRIGHIQVAKAGYFESGQAAPFAFLLSEDSPDRVVVERTPGVRLSGARLSFGGTDRSR